MEQDQNTISDFNMNLIIDFFKNVDRQGPGCAESSRRALGFIPTPTADSTILDIGCGTGKQTEILASETAAQLIATDIASEMLVMLKERLAAYGDRLKTVAASMDSLPIDDSSVDTVWAEGSIFIVGFRNGLRMWRRLLKAGGYIVVSDAAWLTPTRPDEIERYWTENYPDIATVAEDIAIMEQEGYSPVGHFTLPEEGWTENYYVPMAREIDRFAAAHPSDPAVDGLLDSLRHEIATYERYKEYYGYVFFIGRKRD
ncbi:MAG: methyltransferase domain-containing protein [Tidjanibacter sp.]|nr:methyltransferase domain-containing protein [Tidjanibacter sp.]